MATSSACLVYISFNGRSKWTSASQKTQRFNECFGAHAHLFLSSILTLTLALNDAKVNNIPTKEKKKSSLNLLVYYANNNIIEIFSVYFFFSSSSASITWNTRDLWTILQWHIDVSRHCIVANVSNGFDFSIDLLHGASISNWQCVPVYVCQSVIRPNFRNQFARTSTVASISMSRLDGRKCNRDFLQHAKWNHYVISGSMRQVVISRRNDYEWV